MARALAPDPDDVRNADVVLDAVPKSRAMRLVAYAVLGALGLLLVVGFVALLYPPAFVGR